MDSALFFVVWLYSSMKKLINGIVDFRKNVRPGAKEAFARLALGQRPDTLFVACSDSRVVPNLFASSDPGDLFVIRNVGNLISPCGEHGISASDESEAAAIEYALLNLPVTEIIVCGHSECSAMQALLQGREFVQSPNLKSWLRHGSGCLDQLTSSRLAVSSLEKHNRLSQLNVLEQIEHLKTYPVVQSRIADGTLRLHGWWFDIRNADVYGYEAATDQYRLIDEEYLKNI